MAYISAEEAIRIIGEAPIHESEPELKWLWQAGGLVLAEDITTRRDIPPFHRSAMDGYAVRTEDVREVPCILEVAGLRAAGDNRELKIGPGQCVKIMTGAAAPEGADAVVMIEHTESEDPEQQVTILRGVKAGENIARRGEDAGAGSVVLEAGQLLTPPALAIIAGVGRSTVQVYPRPRVSILSTGDELVEPGTVLTEEQVHNIYNSNATILTGLLRLTQLGNARYLGISKDDRGELREAIQDGLTDDVLILTGGVSKGDYDYAHEVLEDCGVQVRFHGVRIKPGRPLFFGSTDQGGFVFGLPGNPVSVLVCYHEFAGPLLRRLAGRREPAFPAEGSAVCTKGLRNKSGRRFYCTAHLYYEKGQLRAEPIPGHGSGDYVTAAEANGVIIVPEETTRIEAGEEVKVHLWT